MAAAAILAIDAPVHAGRRDLPNESMAGCCTPWRGSWVGSAPPPGARRRPPAPRRPAGAGPGGQGAQRGRRGARPDRPRAARRGRPQRQRDRGPGRAAERRVLGERAPDQPREALRRDRAHRPPGAGRAAPAAGRHARTTDDRAGAGTRSRAWPTSTSSSSQVREAGLPVELPIEGEPVPLPPGVDLSAYRIVQEALTNALKHAGASRAEVLVRYARRRARARGQRRRPRRRPTAGGGGHGLVGMRERVALYGGELGGGPRDPAAATRARPPAASSRARP